MLVQVLVDQFGQRGRVVVLQQIERAVAGIVLKRRMKQTLTYRCQDTPSGVLSFKFKYAEIRLEACYSLFSFRNTATDSARF